MQIIWYGSSCFKLSGSEINILINPFSPAKEGFKNPRLNSEIIIFSSNETKKKISTENFILSSPGEVEIKNVFIQGIPHFEGNNLKTIYKINFEDLKICFLGEISKNLSVEEIDKLGEIDILFISFCAKNLSPKEVSEIVNEVEPSLIVPMNFKDKKGLSIFIKELGLKEDQEIDKLKIRKKDLSEDKISLSILTPNS